MGHFFLRLLIVANVLLGSWAYSKINSCKEAKTGGACSDIVDTAINICEDKQEGKDITSSRMKKAQETKFDKSSDFSKLISEYKEIESSSKKDANNQKACKEAAKALKSDCEDLCKDGKKDSCDQGVDALKDIENFCKKGEEASEQIAEMASEDAALFESGANYDYSGIVSSSSSSGNTYYTDNSTNNYYSGTNNSGSSSSAIRSPALVENTTGKSGYILKSVHPEEVGGSDDSVESNKQALLDKIQDRLKGTSELASADATALGDLESAMNGGLAKDLSAASSKNTSGEGLNSADTAAFTSSKGNNASDEAAANAAKAGASYLPGYMLWGTPKRKKSAMKIY
jgi:hypothetical protein